MIVEHLLPAPEPAAARHDRSTSCVNTEVRLQSREGYQSLESREPCRQNSGVGPSTMRRLHKTTPGSMNGLSDSKNCEYGMPSGLENHCAVRGGELGRSPRRSE